MDGSARNPNIFKVLDTLKGKIGVNIESRHFRLFGGGA